MASDNRLIRELVDEFYPPDTYDNWPIEVAHDYDRRRLISRWQHPIQAGVVESIASYYEGMPQAETTRLIEHLKGIARKRIAHDHREYRIKEVKTHILKAKVVGVEQYLKELRQKDGGKMGSLLSYYFRPTLTVHDEVINSNLWSKNVINDYQSAASFKWATLDAFNTSTASGVTKVKIR